MQTGGTAMQWQARQNEDMGPVAVYEILKKHRLLPHSPIQSAAICNGIGTSGQRFTLSDGESDVAEIFVSGIESGECASLDLIPVASHFRREYESAFVDAMKPILDDIFIEMDVRRLSSAIPASRSRTKKALCVLGFELEGRLHEAVKLHNEEPQDLRVLAILRSKYIKGD